MSYGAFTKQAQRACFFVGMLSMLFRQRSESLRPNLIEVKGSETQGRAGDGTSERSVEQNCGPMNKNRLRGAKGGRAGK